MAYTVNKSSGSLLATIQDGTINTSASSLTLIGKNYAGYGNFLNENLTYLLENFANSTAPSNALTGQLWYDNSEDVLKVYNGTQWKPISSSAASSTAPSSPVIGDLWWDTTNLQLKVWSGSAWVTIGPTYTSSSGTSGPIVETILDTGAGSHIVNKFLIADTVMAIISKDAAFTPQTSIAGFTTIKPGFNLVSSGTVVGSQFSGDVTNALTLQGVSASQLLRSDQNTSTNYVITAGGGLNVGSSLAVNVNSSTGNVSFTNTTNDYNMNFFVTNSGNVQSVPSISIDGPSGEIIFSEIVKTFSSILPTTNNTANIGSAALKYNTIHATTVTATSTQAQYADLAERFESDRSYQPGTVVEIGGLKEITAVVEDLSEKVFGVISSKAAYLMNAGAGSDDTHPPIAVNGRVPVRVVGSVSKGDRLVSAGNGLARAASRNEMTAFNVIGRALENKDSDGEGIVEAIVKLNS